MEKKAVEEKTKPETDESRRVTILMVAVIMVLTSIFFLVLASLTVGQVVGFVLLWLTGILTIRAMAN